MEAINVNNSKAKRHVLLVEDNPKDEFLTLRALNKMTAGLVVDVVRDGQEALDYLFAENQFQDRQETASPGLVILDLKLPKIGGLEVLKRIRSDPRTRLIPVVVLTSSDEHSDLQTSYELGVNSYVCKPIPFPELNQIIGRLGQYWLSVNSPPPGELQ
ncbi:response regulator receiver [Oleiphilus messinensis]|uniref:Response regulator receiver n=1 Tax=Oleiphilus messinensis TaxID=141451 RepID=A0A1Y0IFU8_9GAMM|nr:response regulator [Oleiphilus messinensis]ARU59392.1 response regulator receiver [Oleiphilus messinensis]